MDENRVNTIDSSWVIKYLMIEGKIITASDMVFMCAEEIPKSIML